MVTTRRQTRRNVADATEDSSVLEAPSPAPASSAAPRRQRKLPVRGKAADDNHDAKEASPDASAVESSLIVEIRAKTDSDEDGIEEVVEEEGATIVGEVSALKPEIEEPSSQVKPLGFTGTKKTFNDDDDVEEVLGNEEDATAEKLAIAPSISEPSDDDSDSDEAPEAVSTSKSAAQAIQSTKAAKAAIAEQAKAQKRKRQERAARLQEQATSRKAASTPQKAGASASASGSDAEMLDADDLDDITPRTQLHLETAAAFSARKRSAAQTPSTKPALPSLLPEEFLASDSEDDAPAEDEDQDDAARPRKARKLATADRTLTRESRRAAAPAADRVVGTTLYRAAAKKRDERLAPRSSKASANSKRDLLVRGRTAVKAKKGFFV